MLKLIPSIISMAATDVGAAIERRKRNVALYAVATLLALTAWIAMVVAGGFELAAHYGPVAAALGIAAGTISAAALIIFAVWLINRAERRKAERSARPALHAALAMAAAPALLRSKPLLGAAALAAIVAITAGLTSDDDQTPS